MTKGKPWSIAQEKELLDLRDSKKTVEEIALLMNKSSDAVKQKLRRLGYKIVTIRKTERTAVADSELIVPEDLPSVEMVLLKLAAAMKALEDPKLTKTDVMRLKALIQTSAIYQKKFAEYVGYLELERKVEMAMETFRQCDKEREAEKTVKP